VGKLSSVMRGQSAEFFTICSTFVCCTTIHFYRSHFYS